MANQRRKDKRMVGFYATEDEAAAMMAAAKAKGMTLADWLRSLIPPEGVEHVPKGSSEEGKRKGGK
jgi:hypothetical protein